MIDILQRCIDCPCSRIADDEYPYHICEAMEDQRIEFEDLRSSPVPSWCPLIELERPVSDRGVSCKGVWREVENV